MTKTLFIDVWGEYFRQILSKGWITQIANNCGCVFDATKIVWNNIPTNLRDEFGALVGKRLDDRTIDGAINAHMAGDRALKRWGFESKDFSPLHYQSIGDLIAIAHCVTDYMVYLSGDSVPWGSSNWVHDSINILMKDPDVMVVNPTWNGHYAQAKAESTDETPTYFKSHMFSDQCYLCRVADFKADIYRETNAEADRIYCAAHGNTFEKRVSAYMRNHNKFRATLKTAAYLTRP